MPKSRQRNASVTETDAPDKEHNQDPRERAINEASTYVPRTELGRKLMEIRARIVAQGQPLLSWEEVERDVAERRGGYADDAR